MFGALQVARHVWSLEKWPGRMEWKGTGCTKALQHHGLLQPPSPPLSYCAWVVWSCLLPPLSLVAGGERERGREKEPSAVEINSNIFPEKNQFPSTGLKTFPKPSIRLWEEGSVRSGLSEEAHLFPSSMSRFPSRGAGSHSLVFRLQTVKLVNTDLEQGKVQCFHLRGFEIWRYLWTEQECSKPWVSRRSRVKQSLDGTEAAYPERLKERSCCPRNRRSWKIFFKCEFVCAWSERKRRYK